MISVLGATTAKGVWRHKCTMWAEYIEADFQVPS